ncbi:Holliday junction resolvase MOC1, chloroplastic-like [Setaria italica]|uniref:Holliday junction resolvase MOC1, chloroplastic-like n=1 Tax=Setaria italica TaxID=4555 RepID=UPI000BE53E35|nr:Holliday junction resolvase MOC1, chloroplastic-like [Setaria italica]
MAAERESVTSALLGARDPRVTSPRGISLRLAPKKALLTSSSSGGRAAASPAASGGVPGVAADPPTGVAPAESAVGAAAASAAGGGADSTPPAAPPIAPLAQGVIPPGPQVGEVIDLDADEAEEAVMTGGRADAPAAMAGSEAEGALAPEDAAAAEAAVPEAEVSAPVAPAGVTLAAETEVPTGVPLAASAATSVQSPGPSADPVVSGVLMPASTATSESASVPPSASSVPGAWRGPVLRWTSRDDPPRRLYALDDAAEWHRWQAMHGGVAQVQAALTSALGVLANAVVPGSQALQEGSREKSDFLRWQRNLWEHFNTERERTRDLTLQLGAAQGAVRDLEGREQAALEGARRAEVRTSRVQRLLTGKEWILELIHQDLHGRRVRGKTHICWPRRKRILSKQIEMAELLLDRDEDAEGGDSAWTGTRRGGSAWSLVEVVSV